MNNSIEFLSGNEALAQGAWEAGLKVACAYPGTPSSEILETLSTYKEVDSQWSVNEKVAFEVALAGAIGGARSLYASKHVGLNVAMDPLMTSAYTGINAGFVIVTADDPEIHSSQNEQDNRYVAKFAKIPLLEPSSPEEAKRFIKEAFDISEKFDIPVLFRMTTRISHSKQDVAVSEREEIANKKFEINIPKYVMVPKNAYKRHIDLEKRIRLLKDFSNETDLNKIEIGESNIGIITDSVSYLYVKETFPEASVLKLGMCYPFPDKLVQEFAKKVKELFVIEELEPFIEEEVKILGLKPKVKHDTFKIGELKPEYIPYIIRQEEKPVSKLAPARKPSLCKGCPHEQVFLALKKYDPVVTGDIGCYTLGALPPLEMLHSCVCMGASITFMEGIQKAIGQKVIAVIGDSTFVHTGVAGLINAAYNKAKGVVIIMDNSTTAMTGSQPHPATGVTIKGEETKKLVLEDLCKACGADNVDVINPHKREELEKIMEKRINEDKLSVIITRFPCILVAKKGMYKTEDSEKEKNK
ncbi:MAG: indolepyruvate ferredoxin oxidoreductase subunit alpha [Spirochaetes bacterium]|nr:indolepyruvate ferredoxin oxidoreductase subunit alpha [Spirochaetota bacterium]